MDSNLKTFGIFFQVFALVSRLKSINRSRLIFSLKIHLIFGLLSSLKANYARARAFDVNLTSL